VIGNTLQDSRHFRQDLLCCLCIEHREAPTLVCHLSQSKTKYTELHTDYLPPLVGCSILITSALSTVSGQLHSSPTSDVGPYRVVRRVPKVSQDLSAIRLFQSKLRPCRRKLRDSHQPILVSYPALLSQLEVNWLHLRLPFG
jgi:hypothetical protein